MEHRARSQESESIIQEKVSKLNSCELQPF